MLGRLVFEGEEERGENERMFFCFFSSEDGLARRMAVWLVIFCAYT